MFGESINEGLSVDPRKVYGGSGAKEGMVLTSQRGLQQILDLSKKNPSNVFLVRDDNYTKFGPYYVKNGKVAKYTVANSNYDFEKNPVRSLKVPKDVILQFTVVENVNSVTEGNAFGMAVTRAKEEGKDEFEFNGKTYRVKKSKKESKLGGWGSEIKIERKK